MSDTRQKEKDAVTIGQIRKRMSDQLEGQISTLADLIRQGYFNLPKAEAYLKDTISGTLTSLQNIDAMASTEVLFPTENAG